MRKEAPRVPEGRPDPYPGATPQLDQSRLGNTGYEIRVRDHLEDHWAAWFEGWTITNLENGEVMLSNSDADQSALHGILNKIRDLNLTLLSVAQK